MIRERKPYVVIADCTAYRDQQAGYADDPFSVKAGTRLLAAADGSETRVLRGEAVRVALFMLGTTWCWIPQDEFRRVARPGDE